MSRNLIVAVGVVILIAVAGSFFYLQNEQDSESPTPSPVSEATPNETATPTLGASASATPEAMIEEEASISATQNGFVPQTITVGSGTKVTWSNNSGVASNVSSDPHPSHTLWSFLNLGTFGNGQSISVVFDTPGTYTFHNHLTPTQRGTVIVE